MGGDGGVISFLFLFSFYIYIPYIFEGVSVVSYMFVFRYTDLDCLLWCTMIEYFQHGQRNYKKD